jgi:HD-GYP domain-containing protein (c-di-GMP phosphodiesterase class II)
VSATAEEPKVAPPEDPNVALLIALQRALGGGRAKQPTAEAALESLRVAIARAHELRGGAAVRTDPDNEELFINDVLVSSRRHGRAVAALLGKLRARGVAELRFARALTAEETSTFVDLVQRSAAGLEPVAACRKIVEGLWSTRLRGTVDIISLEQYGHAARAVKVEPAVYLRLIYARLLTLMAEYLARPNDKELRRHFAWRLTKAMQNLVHLAGSRERELLAFVAQARGAEVFLVRHAVNTGILAVLLGQRLGLPKDLLCQLGLAGLLAWSGKSRTPPAVVNKPAARRTPEEAKDYGRHPYRALGAIFEMRRLEEPLLLAALAAAQYDTRPGCPPRRRPLEHVHPLAQIVGLCDAFDGFMTSKPGAPPQAPHAALNAALSDKRRGFDPTLVQLFVGLLASMPGPQGT